MMRRRIAGGMSRCCPGVRILLVPRRCRGEGEGGGWFSGLELELGLWLGCFDVMRSWEGKVEL